jgi:phosphoribosyl-ATP pyrophosphohydrolase
MPKFDFEELYRIIQKRIRAKNRDSYSYQLFTNSKLLNKKILEEAQELIKTRNKKQVVWETSDLLYFTIVFLVKRKVSLSQVKRKLKQRNEKMKSLLNNNLPLIVAKEEKDDRNSKGI